jgi:hypothetical protein
MYIKSNLLFVLLLTSTVVISTIIINNIPDILFTSYSSTYSLPLNKKQIDNLARELNLHHNQLSFVNSKIKESRIFLIRKKNEIDFLLNELLVLSDKDVSRKLIQLKKKQLIDKMNILDSFIINKFLSIREVLNKEQKDILKQIIIPQLNP